MGVPLGAHLEVPRCAKCHYRVYPNREAFPRHLCPEERDVPAVSPMLHRDTTYRMLVAQDVVQGWRK